MSLLEVFNILFTTNTDDVKKGADTAKKATDQLENSIKNTNSASNQLAGSFSGMLRQIAGPVLSLLSLGALVSGITNAVHYADRLHDLSNALNINIESLSVWSDAVRASGGSAEGFHTTVANITRDLAVFSATGKSRVTPFFKALGVSLTDSRGKVRSFLDILPNLADAFQRIGKEQSFGIGKRLGLDEGTILLLQRGRREVEAVIKRQRELGVVTKQDGEISAAFKRQWDDTAIAFRSIFLTIGQIVLPVLQKFAKGFEILAVSARQHKGLIEGVLIAIGTAALVASLKFLPLIAITAGILLLGAAFAIVYEDVKAFLNGQRSLLGELIEKYPWLGKVIRFVVNEIKETIKILGMLGNAVLFIWKELYNFVNQAFEAIKAAVDTIINAYKKVKSFIGLGEDSKIDASIEKTNRVILEANQSPFSKFSPSSHILSSFKDGNTKNTTINTGPINIQTQATDANGIASSITSGLNSRLRQAQSNFDDGVLA